jgi:hypothetical protein
MPETLQLATFVDLIAKHSFNQVMSGGSGQIDNLAWPAAIYGIDRGELYARVKARLNHMEQEYYRTCPFTQSKKL